MNNRLVPIRRSRSAFLLAIVMLVMPAHAWADDAIDRKAKTAVRAYVANFAAVKNFQVNFKAYNWLSPKFIEDNRDSLELPGRRPLMQRGDDTYQFDHFGQFTSAESLQCERVDYESPRIDQPAERHLFASNGTDLFRFEFEQKNGSRSLVSDSHAMIWGIAPLFGKRVTSRRPYTDLFTLVDKAKSLEVEDEDNELIHIVAHSDGFHDDFKVEYIVRVALSKKCGYLPAKWEVRRADWAVIYTSGSASGFFSVGPLWLPKEGVLNYHSPDKVQGVLLSRITGVRLVTVDADSARINLDLPADFFSPPVPDDGKAFNQMTKKWEIGKNYREPSTSAAP